MPSGEATASGAAATLELELETGSGVKALTLTLVPCRYRGATTCFALGTDITDHRTLRTALEESEASLRQQAAALSDSNTALRVILDQRNRDRAELERTIADNVDTMILPMLGRLAKPLAATPQAVYLDAAVQGLREVVSPLAQMGPGGRRRAADAAGARDRRPHPRGQKHQRDRRGALHLPEHCLVPPQEPAPQARAGPPRPTPGVAPRRAPRLTMQP